MTKKEFKNWLEKSPGISKWGYNKLATKSKLPLKTVKKIVKDYRQVYMASTEIKITPFVKSLSKQTTFKEDLTSKLIKDIRLIKTPKKFDVGNVLVISDTHEPFSKEGYLDFCLDIQNKYQCGTIVHIGDEIDNCAISQYAKDPDGLSAGSEAYQALKAMKDWYKAFPNVNVCIGNHSNRMFRLAHLSGIPKRMLKSYEELWEAPRGWNWVESLDLYGVHYTHGTGTSGPSAALKRAVQLRKSVVQGHIHTEAGIQYNVSSLDAIWGMQVGCGISDDKYAFAYAKDNVKKSIISCGVVLEKGRLPILELMPLK